MIDVKGKWALITGASRGIGRLVAGFMAERGCNLIVHSRSETHSEPVARELGALGIQAVPVSAELSDIAQVRAMLSAVDALDVPVDFVFNNAAVQIAYRRDYLQTPLEDFEISFRINTIAPAVICYHFLPRMVSRGFGRIVNTTSGIRNEPEQAGYSASKAALDKFTKDLGTKYEGTDVCINLTDPGWCRTDLGGPNAPNDPSFALPGVVVGAFIDDRKSGRLLPAAAFAGMTLEDAIAKAATIERD